MQGVGVKHFSAADPVEGLLEVIKRDLGMAGQTFTRKDPKPGEKRSAPPTHTTLHSIAGLATLLIVPRISALSGSKFNLGYETPLTR